jgi:hypothetical protein
MRTLYSLCYRIGGSFEGVALVEADSLPAALLRAELEQLYPGGECRGPCTQSGRCSGDPGQVHRSTTGRKRVRRPRTDFGAERQKEAGRPVHSATVATDEGGRPDLTVGGREGVSSLVPRTVRSNGVRSLIVYRKTGHRDVAFDVEAYDDDVSMCGP